MRHPPFPQQLTTNHYLRFHARHSFGELFRITTFGESHGPAIGVNMPSFTRIKETCLYVNDLHKTKEFYHGKLGLQVIGFADNRHVFFRAGDSVLLCFISESTKNESALPPHYGQGNLHFAFETSNDQYHAWKEKIISENILIEHEAAWKNNLKSFYFRDPDGHLVEIAMTGIWE